GLAVVRYGLIEGMHMLFIITIGLAVLTLAVVSRVSLPLVSGAPSNIRGVWQSFPSPLRWLLVSDVFIRTCEGLVDVFAVIYAMNIIGLSASQYGVLIAVQAITSIVAYAPAAQFSERFGRK